MISCRIFAAALTLVLAAPLFSGMRLLPAEAAPDTEGITLFSLNSSYAEYISIPEDAATSFQIEPESGELVGCRVISGNSVTVTNDGLIEPAYETWYWNGGMGSTVSWGVENEKIEKRPKLGNSVVEVTTDDSEYDLIVSVKEYGEYYADKVIIDYVAENITDDMTIEEKLEAVVKLPASYDYSPYASGYVSMIVKGGGDCWGSSGIILEELELLGIKGWIRNGNRDTGAGSGHRNVLAEIDGAYYELEAGYSGTAPRMYDVKKRSSLYNFRRIEGGYKVYQYDGVDESITTLEIPTEYNNEPVIGLSQEALSNLDWVEEVVLPDSIQFVEGFAFYNMSGLRKLTISEGLSSIGGGAFIYCDNLEDFEIGEGNEHFAFDGSALYNKDLSELVYILPRSADYIVPESVTAICEQASRYDRNRTEITIPGNVRTIGEGAFHNCAKLEKVTLEEGIEEIGSYSFAANTKLKSVTIPDSVTMIGENAFGIDIYGKVVDDFVIYGSEGSEAQRYAERTGVKFEAVSIGTDEIAYGDANCDGSVNLADAVMIMQYLSNPAKYGLDAPGGITEQGLINADVKGNGDGVTNLDALTIQRFSLGIVEELPDVS